MVFGRSRRDPAAGGDKYHDALAGPEAGASRPPADAPPADAGFTLTVAQFPPRLHDTLREIDDEGNGILELDEITEVRTWGAQRAGAGGGRGGGTPTFRSRANRLAARPPSAFLRQSARAQGRRGRGGGGGRRDGRSGAATRRRGAARRRPELAPLAAAPEPRAANGAVGSVRSPKPTTLSDTSDG